MEVAHIGHHVGGILACEQVEDNVARTIDMLSVANREVAYDAVHLVEVLHVGVDVEMGASCHRHRRFGEVQMEEVGVGDVARDGAFEALAAHQRVDVERAFHERVAAVPW